MNLIKSNFSGIDRSNEISLLEYGLLVYNDKHEDNSGTQFCVYKITDNSYGCGHFSEKDINDLLQGNDWMCKADIDSFMDYVGSDIDTYINLPFVTKLSDLIQYYGTDNVCGTDYSPMTEEEVIERYL